MIGVTTSSSVSRTICATSCWFQPRTMSSIALRSFSIFASSAPTIMKTTWAYALRTIARRDRRPSR